jgi:alanyl-tRNA synthetase
MLLTIASKSFKPMFVEQAPKATSSQQCIRTNEIKNVRPRAGHHMFFKILGNFSFGNLFKT